MKHLGILCRYKGERASSLLLQSPIELEESMLSTIEQLRKDAWERKVPVEYSLVELDGVINPNNIGKEEKELPARKIIIPSGTFKGMEIYLERDRT